MWQNSVVFPQLSFSSVNQAFEFHSKCRVKFEIPLETFLRTEFVSQKQPGPAAVGVSQGFCGIELDGSIIVWQAVPDIPTSDTHPAAV